MARINRIFIFVSIALAAFLFFKFPRAQKNNGYFEDDLPLEQARPLLRSFLFAERSALSLAEAKLALFGRKIFFDPRFSANGKISCATCHKPELSFTDGLQRSHGMGVTRRNAQTLVNVGANHWFFWDGRADSLAMQALGPLGHIDEQGLSRGRLLKIILERYQSDYEQNFGPLDRKLIERLADDWTSEEITDAIPLEPLGYALASIGDFAVLNRILKTAQSQNQTPVEYLRRTYEVLPTSKASPVERQQLNQITLNTMTALAAFERTIRATDTPFDRFARAVVAGKAIDQSYNEQFGANEWRGFKLFTGKARCTNCHFGPQFSDQQFHNIGLPQVGEDLDLGRTVGIAILRGSSFNCIRGLTQKFVTEGCAELPFLDHKSLEHVGAFKTPTLRNLQHTAPYFHDGRAVALKEVLEHYQTLSTMPAVGHREESLQPLRFAPENVNEIEAFLNSLSGPVVY